MANNLNSLVDTVIKSPYIALVLASYYAVDAFFWLSGFFLAYVCADKNKLKSFKKNPTITCLAAVANRLLRIWVKIKFLLIIFQPCYFIVIFFLWGVADHLGNGPVWPGVAVST